MSRDCARGEATCASLAKISQPLPGQKSICDIIAVEESDAELEGIVAAPGLHCFSITGPKDRQSIATSVRAWKQNPSKC
jgi:hypothetical protein